MAQKEVKPTQKTYKELPQINTSITSLSKSLSPDPINHGVEPRLTDYLESPDSANLSFIVAEYHPNNHPQPSYRWKINKLKLKGTGAKDTHHTVANHSIGITLLNKDLQPIMGKGYGEYYVDFWSSNTSESKEEIEKFFKRAVYYTIYTTKPQGNGQ